MDDRVREGWWQTARTMTADDLEFLLAIGFGET